MTNFKSLSNALIAAIVFMSLTQASGQSAFPSKKGNPTPATYTEATLQENIQPAKVKSEPSADVDRLNNELTKSKAELNKATAEKNFAQISTLKNRVAALENRINRMNPSSPIGSGANVNEVVVGNGRSNPELENLHASLAKAKAMLQENKGQLTEQDIASINDRIHFVESQIEKLESERTGAGKTRTTN